MLDVLSTYNSATGERTGRIKKSDSASRHRLSLHQPEGHDHMLIGASCAETVKAAIVDISMFHRIATRTQASNLEFWEHEVLIDGEPQVVIDLCECGHGYGRITAYPSN